LLFKYFACFKYLPVHTQNVHLVARWLNILEKKLEETAANGHINFRVFISAEPAPTPESHIMPQGILESSIKITNEPPTGMFANLHKALDNFNQASAVTSDVTKVLLLLFTFLHIIQPYTETPQYVHVLWKPCVLMYKSLSVN
jgi:Dynein heavy chain region D6 P-loop domain